METFDYLSKYWKNKNKKAIFNDFDEVLLKVKDGSIPPWDKIK
jgi:hypothetical protein